jgi:hypothetical protein
MATAAGLLMWVALGVFICYGLAKRDGNAALQVMWGLIAMFAVGIALALYGFIALKGTPE